MLETSSVLLSKHENDSDFSEMTTLMNVKLLKENYKNFTILLKMDYKIKFIR